MSSCQPQQGKPQEPYFASSWAQGISGQASPAKLYSSPRMGMNVCTQNLCCALGQHQVLCMTLKYRQRSQDPGASHCTKRNLYSWTWPKQGFLFLKPHLFLFIYLLVQLTSLTNLITTMNMRELKDRHLLLHFWCVGRQHFKLKYSGTESQTFHVD